MSRDDKKLPPWTGDDKWMQAWMNAQLDAEQAEIDAAFEKEQAEAASLVVKAYARPDRSPEEKRKRRLTIGRRVLAKDRKYAEALALEEAESKNLEPLRKLNPSRARFINSPLLGGRNDHFRKAINHDPLSPEARLEEALDAEVPRIRAIWKREYGKMNRPTGELTAAKIAAERWGLTEEDVRSQHVSRATRLRLARESQKKLAETDDPGAPRSSATPQAKRRLSADEQRIIDFVERGKRRKLTEQEINLSLEQARALGEL